MNKKLITIFIFFFLCSYLHATVLINSADGISQVLTFSVSTDTTRNQAVGTKAYNPASGTFYVGLTAAASPTTLNIAQFSRPVAGQQLNFTGLAGNDLQNEPIDFLALINGPGKIDPLLAGVIVNTVSPDGVNPANPLTQTQVAVQTTQPTNAGVIASVSSTPLLGTNNRVSTANGSVIYGIAGIAAGIARDTGRNFIFAAVSNALLGPPTNGFGNAGSGIAVLNAILTRPSSPNSPTIIVRQVAAEPNQTGIKAALLDPTSTQISIGMQASITTNRVSLFWDDPLQRLYIGLQVESALDPASGARSVVVGRLQPNEQGELNFDKFLPDASLIAGQTTNIVGAIGQQALLSAAQLHVMHASTGPSYLILQGGNGIITTDPNNANGTVGNLIWALPLVDLENFTNPNQGLLANKNMFNAVTHHFEVPAINNADLTNISDPFAQVGAGPLPLQPYTPISGAGAGMDASVTTTQGVVGFALPANSLDINVIGDTVYVAIASPQTDVDDTGVFYSQAMFDNTGKIIRWTPWSKRAFTFNAFPTVPENRGEVRFINVDPTTGNIIGVEGLNGQAVTMTAWNTTPFSGPFIHLLNQHLSSGCLSVLDLDQTTTGLAADGPSRYTLFGGTHNVIFARTILSRAQFPPYNEVDGHPAPQKLTTFINSHGNLVEYNFLVTQVGDACINSLEYSRTTSTQGNTNYFFAGTHSGLYVFADSNGQGFNSTELGAPNFGVLTQPPFSNCTWQRISTIPGSIVDIKTSGAMLYVMVATRNGNGNMENIIYSIAYTDNIATMFAPSNLTIIAQTQIESLATQKVLYSMQIIQMGMSEQLIIATNNGLYMSSTVNGVQTAMNQAQALWTLITDSQNILWRGMGGIDTPQPAMVFPFNLTDPTGLKIYNQSDITQLTGGNTQNNDGITPVLSAFNPDNFNANISSPGFTSFNPITYFWSDGLRRFFITQPLNSLLQNSSLIVSPFNVLASRLANPTTLANLALNSVSTLNWVKQIGATGIFMAGTNSGVVAFD